MGTPHLCDRDSDAGLHVGSDLVTVDELSGLNETHKKAQLLYKTRETSLRPSPSAYCLASKASKGLNEPKTPHSKKYIEAPSVQMSHL